MDSAALIVAMVLGSVGATLLFVGSLICMLTAFGNKQYFMGILMALFFPASLIYCALNWKRAVYPGKLVYTGGALLVVGLVVIGLTVGVLAR